MTSPFASGSAPSETDLGGFAPASFLNGPDASARRSDVVELAALGSILASAEVFTDGDWVESKDQDPEGDVRLIQLADVGVGTFIDKSDRFVTSATAQRLHCTFLKPGDVLVARMPDPIGRACLFPRLRQPCITVVDVCVIRPNPQEVDAAWLAHALNAPTSRHQVLALASGTTRSRISRKNLEKIRIPLPSLPEQRRVADVLDRVEALRAKRREAIAHFDTLSETIFLDMFGDPATAGETDQSTHLGDLLTFVTSGSRGWAEYYVPSGMRFVRSLDVQMNLIASDSAVFVDPPSSAEARRTGIQAGDVLLTITGSRIGRVAAAPEDLAGAYVSQHVAILRLDQRQVVPEFVAYFLSMKAGGQRQIAKAQYGQTKPGLNLDQIRSLHVPRPSVVDQEEFKKRLTAARSVAALQTKALATLDALFSSLQHRAFRGEL